MAAPSASASITRSSPTGQPTADFPYVGEFGTLWGYDSSRASVRVHREPYNRRLTSEKAIAAGAVSRPHILRRSAQWLRDRALGRVCGVSPLS